MLQQARSIPRYAGHALTLLTYLVAIPSTTNTIPEEYHKENLATALETNVTTLFQRPVINKVNTQKQNSKPRRQYTNPVACKACGQFGHNIGEQVCRYTAQYMNVQQYLNNNTSEATTNLNAYNSANAPRTINMMKSDYPENFTPDMSPMDVENELYHLAKNFFHSDGAE